MTAAAMKDPRALKILLALMHQLGVGEEEEQVETVDTVDLEFLESHLVQERKKQKRSNSGSAGGEAKSDPSPKKNDE